MNVNVRVIKVMSLHSTVYRFNRDTQCKKLARTFYCIWVITNNIKKAFVYLISFQIDRYLNTEDV